MPWTNYHSHSHYCDGEHPIENHILKAIEKDFIAIGISSHMPVYFHSPWALKRNEVNNYIKDIDHLREKYKDRIQVYKSMEVEVIPGLCGPGCKEVMDYNLDYVVGSIHFVNTLKDGIPWGIDGSFELFKRGFKEIYDEEIKEVIKDYYLLTMQMVDEECPEVIGHVDKIKMHGESFFSEKSDWYIKLVDETLDLIREKQAIVEVNTRGIYKGLTDEPYPSWWILKKVFKLGIPVQLNSDSHHPDELDGAYRITSKRLHEIGFRTFRVLINNSWQDIKFNEKGLNL